MNDVMKKHCCFAAAVIMAVCACLPVYSQAVKTKVGGKLELSSGYVESDTIDGWMTLADITLSVNASAQNALKVNIEGTYKTYTVPETDTSPDPDHSAFELAKAYAKLRLPLSETFDLRIHAGKQPMPMGFGLFYNAGDLIFPADSSDNAADISSTGLDELRGYTDWAADVQLNAGDVFTLDTFYLFPFDIERNADTGRAGLKALFKFSAPVLESIEAGFVTQVNAEKMQASLSLDGNIWADYNLCSSVCFDEMSSGSSGLQFNEDLWNISAALQKVFNIRTDIADHSLTARVESLAYPAAEKLALFGYLTYDILTSLTVEAYYIFDTQDVTASDTISHTAGASLSWEPISSAVLSLTALGKFDGTDEMFMIKAGLSFRF